MWADWIDGLRLSSDAGLMVLIWIVQTIIYPSFKYFSNKELQRWHSIYTMRIGYIVLPLMLIQLGIAVYQVWTIQNEYTLISLVLIILVWLSTFVQFVPRHQMIAQGKCSEKLLKELVDLNWIRTLLWTLLFLLSFFLGYAYAK